MNITATKREGQTKGERKKRLRQGFIPAAIYGKGLTPLSVEVSAKSIAGVLMAESGLNTVIDLTITGDKATHSVIIDNLERDPLTRGFRNVGFHQVRKGDKVTAQIPIQLVGTPRDVTINGALLEQILDTITVHAQPTCAWPICRTPRRSSSSRRKTSLSPASTSPRPHSKWKTLTLPWPPKRPSRMARMPSLNCVPMPTAIPTP
jgi:ribosomal protein bL25 (Ctc-form)